MTRLLSRSSLFAEARLALPEGATLHSTQLHIDQALHSFGKAAGDTRSLLAMSVGGIAYQVGRAAALSFLPAFTAPLLGLACETTVFRSTHALLSNEGQRPRVLGQEWFCTAIDFAFMKGMGQLSLRQSAFLRSAAQSTAVVLGQDFSASLSLLPTSSATYFQRFTEASLMGLEMGAGLYVGSLATRSVFSRIQSSIELKNRVWQRRFANGDAILRPSPHYSNEMSSSLALERTRSPANRQEILQIHRELGFKDSFTRASLDGLLQSLEQANLSPQVSGTRLRALREIESFHARRQEFLRRLLEKPARSITSVDGRARFVDFESLKKEADRIAIADLILPQAWVKDVFRAIQGSTVLADVNFGRREAYLKVVDHHGIYAQERNATEQMIDSFEEALRAQGGEEALRNANAQQVHRAIKALNIREVSTDNLADGAWCVWIAQNQRRVLMNPDLRRLIREATRFEDFSAFGNDYERGAEAVELQAALFKSYGDRLRSRSLQGSDRFPAAQAHELMKAVTRDINLLLRDKVLRRAEAAQFWLEVDTVREVAAQSVVLERARGGRRLFAFYDTGPIRHFSIFAQWLGVPDIQRSIPRTEKIPLQATIAPMPALRGLDGDLGRILPIVAIPHARRLPSGKGLLGVLPHVNAAEADKVRALAEQARLPMDSKANFWFGRDSVILPNPAGGGTLLTADEIAEILMRPELGLFHE